jgi:alpha-mannosidase
MLAHFGYTHQRLTQLAERFWQKVYPESRKVDAIELSERCERIPFAEAQKLAYQPAAVGVALGPVWATFWFRVRATVPREWAGRRVDLLWNSRSEATLWVDGRTAQGLNFEAGAFHAHTGVRPDAVLLKQAKGGESVAFQVEVACNRMFGGASSDSYRTVSPFVLDQCELALFDREAWDLANDLQHLVELAGESQKDLDKAWGGLLLSELNRFANAVDEDDRRTWASAREILKPLFARTNASVVHELTAVGHAHIDTAWLWPIAETWRKCMRTFSSQVAYMDEYPEYRFVCSQAVQYAKMQEMNPELYARIKAKVATRQFVPVGGSWVEPDCNIPSGEALIRQFVFGQRFFAAEFGAPCREFWNPDVFGYNGQLPQIMRLCGVTRFLTQKLSWNYFNKPLHHTFDWEGIDGSKVLAHFPPADTYNATAHVGQLRDNARNYKDHDRSRHSMMLFGFGDGGGGPIKRMIEQLLRAKDLEGLPRTRMRTSDEFFDLLERDCVDRPTMVGELYFELHRGTYTTQGATKRGNRLGEFMLHDIEFLAGIAARIGGKTYPKDELDRLWRVLLTNQFHDILPGSSIREVYVDAERDFAEIQRSGHMLREQALAAVVSHQGSAPATLWAPVNTTSFQRKEVATRPDGTLAMVEVPSYGVGKVVRADDHVAAQKLPNGGWRLENLHLRAELAADGRLLSLVEKGTGREALAAPGNVLELYDDRPTAWDAWDVDPYHLETGKPCAPAESATLSEETTAEGSAHHRDGNIRVGVTFVRRIGAASRMTQVVSLAAGARRLEFRCEAEWRERHKFLKVAFPLEVRAMSATYEMQFGAVERPTHFNTSHDLARFEVPGHKWADLSEAGFGVALLSDCKYGWSCLGSTLRLSLLRAPTSPDAEADQGRHVFAYALLPHAGDWRQGGVVAEAFAFNCPLQWGRDGKDQHWRSYASVSARDGGPCSLVLDTIKRAEDSGALVLRLYEAHGGRGTARLNLGFPAKSVRFTDGLERTTGEATVKEGVIEVPYKPFQVVTLLVD